ncbi:prostaglandin E2 receptor EP4 subtype-like [Saccostrea cucullata]|uniref:prostaglandin E2 receptor EP4 subtype-like n=1 Tax=Saccostrea cuccullata TaxID=36930 RepID=UPI002ED12816
MNAWWISNGTNNFSHSNTTEETISESIIPPTLQYLFGVLGNIMAIFLLCKTSSKHKWKPFYRLVCCLAITDFCEIGFVYPAVMIRYISKFTFIFPKQLCEYCSFWFSFCFMSSALIVTAMSLDRFIAVRFPISYQASQRKRINILLAVIWVLSGTVSSLNLMGVGSVKNFYPGSWCFIDFANNGQMERVNTFVYSIIGFAILSSTVVLNVAVVCSICRKPRFTTSNRSKKKKGDVFIVVFLFAIVTLFSICWVPLMVRMLINASTGNSKNGPDELLAVRMTVSNAIVDPWVYIILRKENLVKISNWHQKVRSHCSKPTPEIYIMKENLVTGTRNIGNNLSNNTTTVSL